MEHKLKALIVEDNPSNLQLFLHVLAAGGYECVYTTRGEDAFELARREKPDIILLDIQLPEMDGFTVNRHLKSHESTKDIKVIALTAHAMKGDKELFIKEGFDGYIPKPIKVREFLETLNDFLLTDKG